MDKLLVDEILQLKKFAGKGGWTFAEINGVNPDKTNPFGWVKVRGSIDTYRLEGYKLMPMGNGKLFFPVKMAIRKTIGKQCGELVHIKLFLDRRSTKIPHEVLECFRLESPDVLKSFKQFTDGERKAYLDWIYSAKKEETKVKRIATMMKNISQGKKA